MAMNPASLEVSHANSTYPAFLFAVYGTVLLETWAFRARFGIAPHALIALAGLTFAAVAWLRYRRSRPVAADRSWTIGSAGWLAAMFVVGAVFGYLASAGWVTPMVFLVLGVQFLPWSRACRSRNDFLASGVLLAAGAAYPLLAAHTSANPFGMLIAGWVLLANAGIALLRRS
jgi:hypothetical protein